MVAVIKDYISKAKKMDKENIHGKIQVITMGLGLITKSLVKVFMYGLTAEPTRANGSITKCTAEDNTPGKMEENIKDSINLIKNMDLEHIFGKTAGNISDSGKIVKDTAEVKSYLLMAPKDKGFGNKM